VKGRKPKPTELKILEGNPGRHPLNAAEPRPQCGPPDCPSQLDGPAKTEWRRLAQELADLGILTRIDRAVLAAYCVAWSRWARAQRKLSKQGELLKSEGGAEYQNPWLSIANRAMEQCVKIASELGMTPTSRSRVPAAAPKSSHDKSRFFRAS
jgi:P27 family predicted phage terminase small subunit